jgi:hypothetical protein
LSNRKATRFAVRFVVLGVAAGTLAGYSAYAKRSARSPDDTTGSVGSSIGPQTANRAAKTDRLAFLIPAASAMPVAGDAVYALASAPPTGLREARPEDRLRVDLENLTGTVMASIPVTPDRAAEPAPAAAPPEAQHAAVAPTPLPHERPKRLPPPPAPPAATNVLDDSQIAGLRGRLRLTSDQAEYWPAVEVALRDVVRTQLRSGTRAAHGGRVNIDVNSPEVQKLIWAAVPLLMRLREDQKSEVRKLARVIGLEQVASQI